MDFDKIPKFNEARELLRKWREDHERKSDEVMFIWMTTLSNSVNKLGDEKWVVLEQVATAALDTNNFVTAGDAILELRTRFPNSDRVRYLQILRLQALGKYDEALKALDQLITKDPTNSTAYKRRIAVFKSQGNITEAIKGLTDYLNKFMSDQEAWSELCDLYLSEGEYSRAIYCAEELILHSPHDYFVHQRAGDIRYTMGGIENLKIAFNYYSQALRLNHNSMRALFGLFLTGSSLVTNSKVSQNEKKDFAKSTAWVAEEIYQRYNEVGSGPEPVDIMLQGAMNNLQITN